MVGGLVTKILRRLKKNMAHDKCKRCGACCLCGSGNSFHWCEYLFFTLDGTPTCMIYEERLGKKLSDGSTCGLRYKTKFDYPGCPYNMRQPIHPFFKDKKK